MIYFDNNATTPVDPAVLEAMLPYFSEQFGNAASEQHKPGRDARDAVELSRDIVARELSAEPREITFTSGATEACNLAIKGVWELYKRKGTHFIALKTEHKAVLDTLTHIRRKGADITLLDVNEKGLPDLKMLEDAIRPDTVLVCAMWANNETGVINPIGEIGKICAEKGTLLFSDATQAVGKLQVDPRASGVQLLAMSGHKLYGPKGIGALYVSSTNPRVKLDPLIDGGGHEGGLRSGTLNVPAIVGLGKALEVAAETRHKESARLAGLRDTLEQGLLGIDQTSVNGSIEDRMSHVVNIRFHHTDGAAIMSALQSQLAVASGSACTSADPDPSHVLMAMGLTRDEAKSSLRFSLGRFNSIEEVSVAVDLLKLTVARLRERSPAWQMHLKGLI